MGESLDKLLAFSQSNEPSFFDKLISTQKETLAPPPLSLMKLLTDEILNRGIATAGQASGAATRLASNLIGSTAIKASGLEDFDPGAPDVNLIGSIKEGLRGKEATTSDFFTKTSEKRLEKGLEKSAENPLLFPGAKIPEALGAKGFAEIAKTAPLFLPIGKFSALAKTKTGQKALERVKSLLPKTVTKPELITTSLPGAPINPTVQTTKKFFSDNLIISGTQKAYPTKEGLIYSAKKNFLDKFSPIESFEKTIGRGVGIPIEKSPFVEFRLASGIGGQVNKRANEFSNVLKNFSREERIDAARYMVARRDLHIASKKGIKTSLTQEQAYHDISLLKQKYGNSFEGFTDKIQGIYNFNKETLSRRVNAGLISKERANLLLKDEPFYYPIEVKGKAGTFLKSGKTFTPQTGIKKLKGRAEEAKISDPLESSVRAAMNAERDIENNLAVSKLVGLRNISEAGKELIVPLKNKSLKPTGRGFDKIKVFENGVEKSYAVPTEIANVVKGLDGPNADFVVRGIGRVTGLFRAGTTGSNVFFMVPNAIRDFVTSALIEGITPFEWAKAGGLLVADKLKKGGIPSVRRFKESKAAFGGLSSQIKSLESTQSLVQKAVTTKKDLFIKTVTNPKEFFRAGFDAINSAGELIENTPRFATFRKVLGSGKSATEAAFRARNVTVDFSRSGEVTKIFNMMVPFVNARIQGNLNVAKAFGKALKGEHTARTMSVVTAYAVAPAVAAYSWNRTFFPELDDDVSEVTKDKYFYLILGSRVDDNGDTQPIGIRIPKSEPQQIFGNLTSAILGNLDANKKLDPKKLFIDSIEAMSPVDFTHKGKFSPTKALGSVLPPIVKAPAEVASNFDFYRQQPIEPEYIKGVKTSDLPPEERSLDNTTELSKIVGKELGVSPIRMDHLIRGMFGQVGLQIADPSQFVEQGKRRFFFDTGGAKKREQFEAIEAAKGEAASDKLRRVTLALKILKNPQVYRGDKLRGMIKDDPQLLFSIKSVLERKMKGLDSVERSLGTLGVRNGERARAIELVLQTLPPEERLDKIKELVQKGIINGSVLRQLKGKL